MVSLIFPLVTALDAVQDGRMVETRAEDEKIDRHGMAAVATLANDSRHIACDCRPNRACGEPQATGEGSGRSGHRAKSRAASTAVTAAGSSGLAATKESALTSIGSG